MARNGGTTLRIEVLGPLRVLVDCEPVDVPGPRRRAVLALLALARGRAVPVDGLLDAVWPDGVPDSGRRPLHSHVSRLRSALGPSADRLRRDGEAYRLDLAAGELDADEARAALDAGGLATLAAALALWRGVALEEFPDVAPLAAEAAGLAELRRELTDRWLEARLGAGGDAELVADATSAVAASPLRERTTLVLVRALAAEGRQAEAMRAANAFRHRLTEETGFDPSPALDALERAVAGGDLLRAGGPPPAWRAVVAPASPLVGRTAELGQLRHRLREGRLVTIVGTGGVGKTRLALEVAAGEADDAVLVELAVAGDGATAAEAVAEAFGVHAPTRDAARHAVRAVAAGRPVLVVLDNCEHLLDAARAIAADLLDAGPDVRVLATSREPLDLPTEHLVRLGPLPVAAHGSDPRGSPAFEAFLAHARRRDPAYAPDDVEAAAIADVVRRLDGLPLAVELAAGRVGSLGVTDLRDRLGRALDVLGSGGSPDERHGTLRSTIAWSYRLLRPGEQRLLRAIAVLPAGLDLDCAEHVADCLGIEGDAAAAVARLVDASVVVAEVAGGRARYRLLETIRAFALDELDTDAERAAAEAAAVDWAVGLAARLGAQADGPEEGLASARLRAEAANLAAVHDLADLDAQVALSLTLHDLAIFSGQAEVTARTLALARRPELAGHRARPALLGVAAEAAWLRGELDLAQRLGEEALAAGVSGVGLEQALAGLATVALFRGDHARARRLYEEAAAASRNRVAVHLAVASLAATYAGDEEPARALIRRGELAAAETGRPSDRAWAAYARGELEARHDAGAAMAAYTEAVEQARLAGSRFVEGAATVGLASLWAAAGRLALALESYRWLVDHWRRAGNWVQLWTTLRNLAGVLAERDDPQCALFVLAAAEAAPEASLVDGATAATHAELSARLEAALGAEEAARVRERAAALPRTTVVDEALEAVEAAIAGRGPAPAGR